MIFSKAKNTKLKAGEYGHQILDNLFGVIPKHHGTKKATFKFKVKTKSLFLQARLKDIQECRNLLIKAVQYINYETALNVVKIDSLVLH